MEKFQAKVAMLDATIRAVMSHGEHVFLDTRQYRMRHPEFKAQAVQRMGTAEFEHMPWNEKSEQAQAAAILDTQEPQERSSYSLSIRINQNQSDRSMKKCYDMS